MTLRDTADLDWLNSEVVHLNRRVVDLLTENARLRATLTRIAHYGEDGYPDWTQGNSAIGIALSLPLLQF